MDGPSTGRSSGPSQRKIITRSQSLKRKSKSLTPVADRVQLEKVLGFTCNCNATLACDPNTGLIAYPAGLESLERQLSRVKGKIIPDAKCNQLQKTLSSITQESRAIAGRPAVSTEHKSVMVKSANGNARYVVTRGQLEELVRTKMTVPRIAEHLHVSESTVKRRLKEYNITPNKRKFDEIGDDELDAKVKDAIGINRDIGANAIHVRVSRGHEGVKVQRQRVRDSVLRVDPVGVAIRSLKPKLQRRVYSTPAPNSVWHIDGNHKLIRWGIVIHAGVDGYSRVCTFCGAAPDNRATTVLGKMVYAVACYGLPQQICTDQGGENNLISSFMQFMRGSQNRPSIRVQSTRNERIERHWNDVWRGATNPYKATFYFLEAEGFLDMTSAVDLWLLQHVYLPRLNRDLESFRHEWNEHKLSTEHHQTPEQLFQIGMLKNANSQLCAVRDFFDNQGIPVTSSGQVDEHIVNGRTLVHVPEKACPLTEHERLQLLLEIHPLAASTNMGIDIYLKAKLLVLRMRIPTN